MAWFGPARRRSRQRRASLTMGLVGALLLVFTPVVLAAGVVETTNAQVATGLGGQAKPKPTPRAAGGATLTATGILRYGNSYPTAKGYERFSYVVVTRLAARQAARLPGTSLVYMNASTLYTGWSTGVSYQEALQNGWLLKDANGAYVMNEQFGGFIGDAGDRGYQERFAANVADYLKRNRIDGVFIDDVVATAVAISNAAPSKYSSHEAWEEAMVSFVANVSAKLRARGFYVLVNASAYIPDASAQTTVASYARFYKRLAPHVDGIMTEYWMQNPVEVTRMRSVGQNWYELWDEWQALASVTQSLGADFFALTYGAGGDRRAMRYGRASFLLDWNGRGGAFIWDMTDRADPFHPVSVKQLGLPVSPKVQLAPGVWKRRYEKGVVIVNSSSSPIPIRIDGTLSTLGPADAIFARAKRS